MEKVLGGPLAPRARAVTSSMEVLGGLGGPNSADGSSESQGLGLLRQALHGLEENRMTGQRRRGVHRDTT
eukprot:1145720-Alexandrium_andersonii.AAC.1